MTKVTNVLIIGYGNPGRQDDGLGPAFIEAFESKSIELPCHVKIECQSQYQLTVEDALEISLCDLVIFADASLNREVHFHFDSISPIENATIASHSISPGALLTLCLVLYKKCPEAYLLGIQGEKFDDFEEALSGKAKDNLNLAITYVEEWLIRRFNHETTHEIANHA